MSENQAIFFILIGLVALFVLAVIAMKLERVCEEICITEELKRQEIKKNLHKWTRPQNPPSKK